MTFNLFRQFLKCNADTESADVYFFCKDGRILPALGQQTFAMIEIEHPNLIRLHNASREVASCVSNTLHEAGWSKAATDGINKEPKVLPYHVLEYSCARFRDDGQEYGPWQTTEVSQEQIRSVNLPFQHIRSSKEFEQTQQLEVANAHALIGKLLLAMNKQGLNLYATTRLPPTESTSAHRSQLIFRQSNVGYSQSLCLNLSGMGYFLVSII